MQIVINSDNKESIYELVYDKQIIKGLISEIVKNCSTRRKSRYVVQARTIEEAESQITSSMFQNEIRTYENVTDIREEKVDDPFDYWRPGDPRTYSFEAEALVLPELVFYLMNILNANEIDYDWFKNRKELSKKENIQAEIQRIDSEINKVSNFDTETKIRMLNELALKVKLLNDTPIFDKELLSKYYDIAESNITLELVQETIKYQRTLKPQTCVKK